MTRKLMVRDTDLYAEVQGSNLLTFFYFILKSYRNAVFIILLYIYNLLYDSFPIIRLESFKLQLGFTFIENKN